MMSVWSMSSPVSPISSTATGGGSRAGRRVPGHDAGHDPVGSVDGRDRAPLLPGPGGQSGVVSRYRWNHAAGCTCCGSGSPCPMRGEEAMTTRMRCAGSWAWTSRPRRSRTRRRCCTSAICWRSMTWAPGCWPSRGEIFTEQGVDHAGGSIVDATIIAAPSSTKNASGTRDGDAPDEEGQPVVLRDEGPHRVSTRDRVRALGDRDSSERATWTRSPTPGPTR